MSRYFLPLAVLGGLLVHAADAGAGYKQVDAVNINKVNRYASGAMGSARKSTDNFQFIGCSVTAYSTNTSTYGQCIAVSSANVWASCTFDSEPFLRAAATITSDSFIYFTWNAAGECTRLDVQTNSMFEPK